MIQNPKDDFESKELKTQLHEKLFFQWEIIEQSFMVTLKLLLFLQDLVRESPTRHITWLTKI